MFLGARSFTEVLYGRTRHSGWVDGSFQLARKEINQASLTQTLQANTPLPGSVGGFVASELQSVIQSTSCWCGAQSLAEACPFSKLQLPISDVWVGVGLGSVDRALA